MEENDIIIGKTHPMYSKKDSKEIYKCCSTPIKQNESGFVDKVKQAIEVNSKNCLEERGLSTKKIKIGH